MTRVALTDGSGRWFQLEKSTKWAEDTRWNGNNMVSVCCGRYDHESLYRTASGRWVLHHWSQWQGSMETWEEIDDKDAARWLSINGHGDVDIVADQLAALEV